MTRTLISSGTGRAVRIGNLIAVAGTTALDDNRMIVGADSPYEQARFIFQKIDRGTPQPREVR